MVSQTLMIDPQNKEDIEVLADWKKQVRILDYTYTKRIVKLLKEDLKKMEGSK